MVNLTRNAYFQGKVSSLSLCVPGFFGTWCFNLFIDKKRQTISSVISSGNSYLKLGHHFGGPRKAAKFVKGLEGREEWRLGDICFTNCPEFSGPPWALKKPGIQVPSDYLGLVWSRQFAVCNWLEICWNRCRLGAEGKVKELRGKCLSWVYTWNFRPVGWAVVTRQGKRAHLWSWWSEQGSLSCWLTGLLLWSSSCERYIQGMTTWSIHDCFKSPKSGKSFRYISITTFLWSVLEFTL